MVSKEVILIKCHNCGVKLSSNSKYCPRCGTILSNKDIELLGNKLENELLQIYIKERKVNFYNISFEFLFLTFLYAFYKKMYYEGIISLLGFIIFMYMTFLGGFFSLIFNSMGFYALLVIFLLLFSFYIYFYYALNFNNIYIMNVKYRISKIIKNNSNISKEELIELCKKDSRGNLVLPIITIILLAIFFLFFLN